MCGARGIADQPLADCEPTGARERRAMVVVLVGDGVDHDRLFMDGDCGIVGDCDPVVWQYSVRSDKRIGYK